MQYDTFLFDLDGTLVNTQAVDYVIHRDLLADLGYALEMNTYAAVFGQTRSLMIQSLLHHVPNPISEKEYTNLYVRRLEAALCARPDLLVPHADTFVQAASSQGIRLAIVTSSPRDVLDKISALEHILPLFQFIVTRDDVTNAKPHPEPYLKAAERLGATNPFVFEDSLFGGISANRAGFPFSIHKHAANHSAARVMATMEHIQFQFDDYANPQVQSLLG